MFSLFLHALWIYRVSPLSQITSTKFPFHRMSNFPMMNDNNNDTLDSMIVFEDDHIIALNKKEGTLSVAGKLNPSMKSFTYTPRHLQWRQTLDSVYKSDTLSRQAHQLLTQLLKMDSVPRNKTRFYEYIQDVTKNTEIVYHDELWLELERQDYLIHKRDIISEIQTTDPKRLSLIELLTAKYQKYVYAVHRLDQETSGVIIYAKTVEAATALSAMFRDRVVKKVYLAKVYGRFPVDIKEINLKIRPDLTNRPLQV